jgi:hypothetical protein
MIKHNKSGIFIVLLLVLALSGMASAGAAAPDGPDAPVSSAFTYQGRLIDGGVPANGAYDLRMRLFDAASGGTQVGATFTHPDVPVSGGYFTIELGFSPGFDGNERWLEIEVRPGASTGSYTLLTPRTEVTAVPYAQGLMPGATVNTTTANVPALRLNAPSANSNALVATGNGLGYAVVYAENLSTSGYGLYGKSGGGTAVYGESGSYQGNGVGVWGRSPDYGVRGTGFIGVWGEGADGVIGHGIGTGVEGYASSSAAFVQGIYGVTGGGSSSAGVYGRHSGTDGNGIGVWGAHNGAGYGVYGNTPPGGYGVVGSNGGSNSSGYAGSFNGRVAVIGTLSKGGGSFRIDHPLDPANKYLSHSFVESPDMMNIYNGNVTTGADGFATVILPDWFEALNRDFRYQLTVIGQFAQAIVAEEIKDNQFRIQTDQPGVKVSWQVTGIRHDPFAEAYRIPVEEQKTGDERGRDLYPDVYGKTVQDSIWYASSPNVRYMIDHPEARERLDADAPLADPARPSQPLGQ